GHGRSQSMAVGSNGRGGSAVRGGGSFQFPPLMATNDAGASNHSGDFQRRGSQSGHGRNSSRNFDGNWRQPGPNQGQPQDQPGQMGSFVQNPNAQNFQPSHRSRGSMGGQ